MTDTESNAPEHSASRPSGTPWLAWSMALCGAAAALFGLALMFGAGRHWHPLLAEDGAGIVFLVSGIALVGSAAFPIVLRRLASAEERAQ
ncbi:hypothetical protein [Cognatazoarcus halotolerans]|uniref:hypothetical protein n=1 Tax=Cognatazoarcus halotolerans TaxID=2686016 RepID=UPI001F2AD1F1|nr:hypothetical protein [Cognatazoarcus halotolerans]